ncbi:fermentation-respiration switch protein FrsA (DUF1100 family) [Sporomusaceae bacterium BoRhaA]|uniref:alpha/beta hydrolase family protein n=1 Tax=Pelorhabdus rhamnosifermentans TaxID=2772457 RepID=UPI001C06390A|nr:prolyl oligopeptidase family serine peptidase [Pelorhabdus rhamnosifermentans]MBU2700505.1 fermentation-respiration switch protein FrsA (DUF1100 family) [Pelorhabdus rhamnosifermentans]
MALLTSPFLLMHGDKDTLVSPSQTEILHQALIAQGIESTRYVVKGAKHGGVYWNQFSLPTLTRKHHSIRNYKKDAKKAQPRISEALPFLYSLSGTPRETRTLARLGLGRHIRPASPALRFSCPYFTPILAN